MSPTEVKTLLLVEDEAIIALAETRMLERNGYSVLAAPSGEKAIEMIEAHPEINLVIMDINLGKGIDGTQAAKIILQRRSLPLVFLSSHTERDVVEKTEGITSYGYIVKNSGETVMIASLKMAFRLFEARQNEKKIAEALRDSERWLRLIGDNTSDLIMAYDMDRRLWYVNKALETLTGYTPAEIRQRNFINWIHPADQPRMMSLWEELYKGRSYGEQEFRLVTKSGQIKWSASTWGPLLDEEGRQVGVQGRERDITERKLVEEALKEREVLLTRAEAIAAAGSWELDLRTRKARWSSGIYAMLGVSPQEDDGDMDLFVHAIHPDDVERFMEHMRQPAKSEMLPSPLEYRIVRPDGSLRHLTMQGTLVRDDHGEPVRHIGIIHDVTERVRIEQELNAARADFRSYFNLNAVGMAVTAPGKNWIEVNDRLCEMLGYTRAELDSLTWAELTHPADLDADLMLFNQVMAGQIETYQVDKRFIRKDKSVLTTSIHVACHRNPDGSVRYFLASAVDNSARQAAQDALVKSEAMYRLLTENILDVIWVYDLDARAFQYMSPSVERLCGYTAEETLALGIYKLIAPAFLPAFERLITRRMEAFRQGQRQFFVDEVELLRKDGSSVFTEAAASFRISESSGHLELYGASRDITARKRAESILQLRLELLDYAVSHSLDELLQTALDKIGELTHSPIGFYHFVQSDQQTLSLQAWSTKTLQNFCHMEGKGLHYDISHAGVWADAVRKKQPIIHNDYNSLAERMGLPPGHADVLRELVVPVGRDGKIVAVLGVGNKPFDYNANDVHLVTYVADVTWEIVERKRAEEASLRLLEDNKVLMRELQHRTKNSLNVVSSLLGMELENLPDEYSRAVFINTQARIRSIATIYEQLYREGNFERVNLGAYIDRLADNLASVYLPAGGRVRIERRINEVYLDLKRALPLGIIVNELVTNAVKYAFPAGASGEIRIGLEKKDGKIMLEVSDNGAGLPAAPARRQFGSGFGSNLIKALVKQIDGTLSLESRPGASIRIAFYEQPPVKTIERAPLQ